MILGITTHYIKCYYDECHAECWDFFIVMLTVIIMVSVNVLIVDLLSVVVYSTVAQ
jgi:hypothetical protein